METVTHEELDRTIFELLRREAVRVGVLPDITDLTADEYEEELTSMKEAGTLVEIFGTGGREARDQKDVHRITILRKNTVRGSLGAYGLRTLKKVNPSDPTAGYREYKNPSGNKNIIYELRSITVSAKYERIMAQIINTALGYGEYVPIVDNQGEDTDKLEFLQIMGDVDVSTNDFTERLFTYQFVEVWLAERTEPLPNIVPALTKVTWSSKTIDGEELNTNEITE